MPTQSPWRTVNQFRRAMPSLVALAGLMSCAEVAAPNDALSLLKGELAKGPAVYVLAQVGDKIMEPMVTLDIQCGNVHETNAVVDTLTIFADGTARRAIRSVLTVNGVEQAGAVSVSPGLWVPIKARNIYYYSDSPSIAVTVFSGADRIPFDLNFRLRGTTALTQLQGMGGGVCAGGALPNTPNVEWVYTRR